MTWSSLQLRNLAFVGPKKVAATLEFRTGINVICGASDTGKSFIVEAVDFLLGGTNPRETSQSALVMIAPGFPSKLLGKKSSRLREVWQGVITKFTTALLVRMNQIMKAASLDVGMHTVATTIYLGGCFQGWGFLRIALERIRKVRRKV
jgi:recombinational DNA repair ATPase RecF